LKALAFPHIIHLTYREGLSSVFPAQVVRPMSLMRERGYPVSLAVFAPIGDLLRKRSRAHWRSRLAEVGALSSLRLRRLPSPPARLRTLWDDAVLLRVWLSQQIPKNVGLVLHCRCTEAARLALAAARSDPRIRVLFDCRGVDGPEHICSSGYKSPEEAPQDVRKRADALEARQKAVAQTSHAIICVSEAMRRELIENWSVDAKKIRVVPCATDFEYADTGRKDRHHVRERLGLGRKFVVAYCGSLAPWQMPSESLAVFRAVADCHAEAHLLALTTQPQAFEGAVAECGLRAEQRTILSVPHNEVPNYLAAADAGLLIRAKSIVNRVASPVKFAEYLSCGLPVIISEGVGDYSELVAKEKLGIVDGSAAAPETGRALQAFVADYLSNPAGWRERCAETGRSRLDWSSAIDGIVDAYSYLQTHGAANQAGERAPLRFKAAAL
jgi:glycosyltransferase involved in cell wall biosynthesis